MGSERGGGADQKKKTKQKKTTLLYLRSLMVIRYSPKEILATTELYDWIVTAMLFSQWGLYFF